MPLNWDLPWFEYEQEQIILENLIGRDYTPKYKDWYRALELCDPHKVKVVILGQDPYPTRDIANGLAFSVDTGKPLQPTSVNILVELKNDGYPRQGLDLTTWAEQGVLLLNTRLTCDVNKPMSHKGLGWEVFLHQVFDVLRPIPNIVYILWGREAQQTFYSMQTVGCVIESAHPSPLSARKGFFGSKPFSRANQYLIDTRQLPIDWSK